MSYASIWIDDTQFFYTHKKMILGSLALDQQTSETTSSESGGAVTERIVAPEGGLNWNFFKFLIYP